MNRKLFLLLMLLFLSASMLITCRCKLGAEKFDANNGTILTKPENENKYLFDCNAFECLNMNKNKYGIVHGIFQNYQPIKTGKGANRKYFNYEILLNDGLSIPVNDSKWYYKKYLGKKVKIKCYNFYGVIIGADDGKSQNATGFRIDIDEIAVDM